MTLAIIMAVKIWERIFSVSILDCVNFIIKPQAYCLVEVNPKAAA